jgi:hypothetical protein
VHYVRLGKAFSKDELMAVVRNAQGDRKLQVAELLALLSAVERSGFASERKRLDSINSGSVQRVDEAWQTLPEAGEDFGDGGFVYAGGRKRVGKGSIWAAVEVGADGRTLTLLKIVDTFAGGNADEQELLADALDRKARGERAP